jgi:hypothetical protein
MSVKGLILLILLCGLSVSVTVISYAQEPAKLFDVKVPQARISSASVPNLASGSAPAVKPEQPAKPESKKSWLRRFFEGMVTSAAKFNTERQNDGRPQPAPGK